MAEEIKNKDARKKFDTIAPIVLAIDFIAAGIIWFLSDSLFKQEEAYLGGLIAGALIIAGIFSYMALKAMARKPTQVDHPEKD